MNKDNKRVSEVSEVSGVSKEFTKNHPSPQRGEGAFVGGAVQMRVRGSILPLKNFSPFTFHFSQQTFRHAERRIDLRDSASQDEILKQVQNDVKDGKSAKKSAFTLAEVLITLGIIGVVAAITMPVMITNYQKHKTVTQLKKFYSILNQAMKLSEAENGEYVNWQAIDDIGISNYYRIYWKPYLKSAKLCTSPSDCGYTSIKPFYDLNGNVHGHDITGSGSRITMILGDGTLLQIMAKPGNAGGYMTVDLNGAKQPNKLGRDVFFFIRTANGQIVPYGYPNGECNGSGVYCAAKIMHDGWKISKDYPW